MGALGQEERSSMIEAMNSTEMRGTPRISSMKQVQRVLVTGMVERRPRASRIPMGSDVAMPMTAMTSVRNMPPQRWVST